MFTILRQSAGALAAAGLLAGASSAAAAILYDNGALNGSIGSFTIGGAGGTDMVSNSFTLNAASIVTGVDFGVWTSPGDTVSTVDWGITTAYNSFSNFIASGTATVTNGPTTLNGIGWPIGVDSISTGPVSLAAGVYYLVLMNAVATNNDAVYWDETDGLSTAVSSVLGPLQNGSVSGSESFQIIGSSGGGVPEPAAWALMLIGVAGLGATFRGARKGRSARFQPPSSPHPPSAILSR